MNAEALVASFLSPSEQVGVTLEALVSSDSTNDGDSELSDPLSNVSDARILAVISHLDEWSMTEEGCLFICSYKHSNNGPPNGLHIQRAYPIFGQFSISMAQTRRLTLDLRHGAVQPAAQPRTGFSVTIHDGNVSAGPLTFFTHDVKKLQQFIQECKRLKEAFESP